MNDSVSCVLKDRRPFTHVDTLKINYGNQYWWLDVHPDG